MRKFFKIYWPFALNEIKREFAYQGRFYLFLLGKLFGALITYYLWVAIYNNSQNNILGGFTKSEMIVYIFMSYIASNIISISIAREISNDVIDGSIAINMIKPIEYRWSLLAKAIGNMIYGFVIPSLFIWIGVEVYRVLKLGLSVTSIHNILLFILSCIMSFFIYVLFDFCFGMIAFFTTYVFGMTIIKNSIMVFLTGELIPLSFFPIAVQKIFNYLPFSSINYVPVMIYLGKYNSTEIFSALLRQIIWIVILYVIGSIVWNRVTNKLVVLGG